MTRLVAGWIAGAAVAVVAAIGVRAGGVVPARLRALAAALVPVAAVVVVLLVAELGGNRLGGVTLAGRRAALQVGLPSIAVAAGVAAVGWRRELVGAAGAVAAVAAVALVDDLRVDDRAAVAVLVGSSIVLSSLLPRLVVLGVTQGGVVLAWLLTTRSPDLAGSSVIAGSAVGAVVATVPTELATTGPMAAALAASLGAGLVATEAQTWVLAAAVGAAVVVQLGIGRGRGSAVAAPG